MNAGTIVLSIEILVTCAKASVKRLFFIKNPINVILHTLNHKR